MEGKVINSNCTLCVNSCGINVYVDKGRIARVEGMPDHPLNKGELCPRGKALLEWEYSPERLKYPLRREGRDWKQITWDEALDVIASKLKYFKEKYEARSVAFQVGSIGSEDRETESLVNRFRGAYGSPNMLGPGICYFDVMRSRMVTFGRFPLEEPDGSKCIVLWGQNPDESNHPKARRIRDAMKAGAKLIVIDPKRIPLAENGLHISPKPGTDLALALAMMNVIVGEALYDKSFIDRWTIGFEQLTEHVKQYTPEWAEKITWVSAHDIRRIARTFAENKPACIIQGTSTIGQHVNGFQTNRAFALLQAITGNVYLPGTWIRVPMPHWTHSRIPTEEKPIGAEKYPLYYELWGRTFGEGQGMSLPDAVLESKPYPVKAVILVAANFMLTQPDSKRFKETFEKLDFFVVMDVRMTETAELASIVLPAATFLEKTGLGYCYAVTQGIPYLALRAKAVEPPGECWSEFRFVTELAKRMGYGEKFPWKTEEDFVDHELSDMKLSVKRLSELPNSGLFFAATPYGEEAYVNGFPTPSGKIELYSETLKNHGYDPIPSYKEPTPYIQRKTKRYPLVLTTGARNKAYTHSQMHNVDILHSMDPEPFAEIHPKTAQEFGIGDGQMALVETWKGSLRIRIKVTEDIAAQVVSVPHGWSQANVNLLTDSKMRDPIIGLPQLKGIPCRLRRV